VKEENMRLSAVVYVAFYLAIVSLISACKIALVAVEGGDIESTSGRFSCPTGANCIVEVSSTEFIDTFIAVPSEGYEFSNWLAGDRLLCGDSTDPNCRIDLRGFAGNEPAEGVIASDTTFYLLPVFVKESQQEEPPEEPPAGLSPALQAKYDNSCDRCHTGGAFGAPVIHNEAAWAPRLNKGMDALVNSVKNGRGSMPPGGDCGDCSDQDYRDLITYMSGPAG
jgi:cytochrome c5